MRTTWVVLGLGLGLLAPVEAQESRVDAVLVDPEGNRIGNVSLRQLEQGVRIFVQAGSVPQGIHAFHIHETGVCEPPDFESAGGHYNPTDADHGFDNPEGPHAGDLPNVHVHEDGKLDVEYITDAITLGEGETTLLDEDGSAIVIHAGPDDYRTEPAGDAGVRIACGVVSQ